MTYTFTIKGRLEGLNNFISANRTHPMKGNNMKKNNENIVICAIHDQLSKLHIKHQVNINYTFCEANSKRDKDNVASFAMKVIQDSLVKTGVLENDGWKNIKSFSCDFEVDKSNPRIVVEIIEIKAGD